MLITMTLTAALAAGPAHDAVTVSASMPDSALQENGEYELVVDLALADGWSAATAGIPKAFLQIDLPDSVQLTGRVVEGLRALARNEFVQEPFERLIEPGATRVGLKLTAKPDPGDAIGLNVIAYVSRGEGTPASFVRRRLELPVRRAAAATPGDPRVSDWGGEAGGLQIGDKADPFSLPRADGTTVSLGDYLGKKHVIVTTYRAFW